MTYKDAYAESLKLLEELDLEAEKDMKLKSVCFSSQRRICLGMALIGGSKV
jgi:ABC-type branched-subunit amino acid transport system ATPase component